MKERKGKKGRKADRSVHHCLHRQKEAGNGTTEPRTARGWQPGSRTRRPGPAPSPFGPCGGAAPALLWSERRVSPCGQQAAAACPRSRGPRVSQPHPEGPRTPGPAPAAAGPFFSSMNAPPAPPPCICIMSAAGDAIGCRGARSAVTSALAG